ncbi:MAG: DUF402 domain-containing protein [Clostridia bacterium]|nr:DUF402 domain-containing protein [Clostridia bacterium]
MENKLKIKTLERADWRRITARRFIHRTLSGGMEAALLRMDEVRAPLFKDVCGVRTCLADRGYTWMQIAPPNENWWLTVMVNDRGEIVQYYFDVTLENRVNGGESCFVDLYLDVIASADGRLELIDEADLDEALSKGMITPEQHTLAHRTADRLLAEIPPRFAELERFCYETLAGFEQ